MEGFFDVGDMPSPTYRIVHYTATDAMGNVARTAVLVRLDRPPVVTFSSPLDDAFAAPSIHVVATCTDDHPNGCEALIIQAGQGGGATTKVTATSNVDQTISLAEFDGQIVVAASGEVTFWTSNPYEIFIHDGSMAVQLTDDGDGDLGNIYPVTDGIHVVYQRTTVPLTQGTASIRLSDSAGDITLASNLSSPEPGLDYQVIDGWSAFIRPDAGNARQIWRRSPGGVESQVSAFGTSSTIEAMGLGGEIVFKNDAVGSERRYRASAGGSPEDIGSGLGRSIYIDGELHVMMGATLLRVE